MQQTLAFQFLGVVFAAMTASCSGPSIGSGDKRIVGSGNVVTISRSNSGFQSIALAGIGKLVVEQGIDDSVTLTTDDNLQSEMISEMVDGTLVLRPRNDYEISTTLGVVWTVRVRRLEKIRTDGTVTVEARDIMGDRLQLDLDGVSTVHLSGIVTRQEIRAAGVVHYHADDMFSEEVDIDGDGILTMDVNADTLLSGEVCGVGAIRYLGSPDVTLKSCLLVSVRRR